MQNTNFEVTSGQVVALLGPSGCGKSTIFRLLLKFHQPDSGHIFIGGKKIGDIDTVQLRHSIAYVGQQNFMFSGSIKDNLLFYNNLKNQDDLENACKTVGMHEFIASLSKGYNTDVGELGSKISGGQAQRLNIARAIIRDAPILLLDEITSALDAENESIIRSYVENQSGVRTVLIIAHRLSTIHRADRIILLQDGKAVASGSHSDLEQSNEYYRRMIDLQYTFKDKENQT